MSKERMVPIMFLVIVLVGVLTLPQGFAAFKPNVKTKYGNKQIPLPSFLHTYAIRLRLEQQHSTKTTYAQQSGSGLPIQAGSLPSNHILERGA